MKKLFFPALLALFASMPLMAQITTGNPTAKKIATGNRPEAGDFGLYMGATSNMFKGIGKSDVKIDPLPLVNFKYMVTDEFEARLGVEIYKKRETIKGDIEGEDHTYETKNKIVESYNRFYPGFAYHFNKHNLLDVYAGAEMPIGWSRNSVYSELDGDDNYQDTRKASFQIGLGAFIGLQAFIGDLPLALGVEYGISSLFDTRLRYKNESKMQGEDEQISYSPSLEELPMLSEKGLGKEQYDELKASKGEIGSQFRITLTYYFK